VHRRGVLRLQPAHALEHPWDRRLLAFEQELAREERSIQLALRERSFGRWHGAKLFAVPARNSDNPAATGPQRTGTSTFCAV